MITLLRGEKNNSFGSWFSFFWLFGNSLFFEFGKKKKVWIQKEQLIVFHKYFLILLFLKIDKNLDYIPYSKLSTRLFVFQIHSTPSSSLSYLTYPTPLIRDIQ